MPKYRITPRAKDDLLTIGRYTQQQWSKTQRTAYLKNIEKRFTWLACNSSPGRHRTDIQEGFYSFPQCEHLIVYLLHSEGIDIIGVPHKEMDILSYFISSP